MKPIKVYRYNEWLNGDNKVLFITGFSGSGKTTLAKQLSETYNAQLISLDDYDYDFVGCYGYNALKKLSIKDYTTQLYFFALSHRVANTRLIIEGVQILTMDWKVIDALNASLLIMDTGVIRNSLNAIVRDYSFIDIFRNLKLLILVFKQNYCLKRSILLLSDYLHENIKHV